MTWNRERDEALVEKRRASVLAEIRNGTLKVRALTPEELEVNAPRNLNEHEERRNARPR